MALNFGIGCEMNGTADPSASLGMTKERAAVHRGRLPTDVFFINYGAWSFLWIG
jgi:hypothetical protein